MTGSRIRLRYEAILVPAGASVSWRRSSLSLRGRLTLGMLVPWFPDSERSRANLVDAFAHESHHAIGFLSTGRPTGERSAYFAGVCAQLASVGRIREEGLPGSPITTPAKTAWDKVAVRSSAAAWEVRQAMLSYFHEGQVERDTPAGNALAARCREEVALPFSSTGL